MLNFLVMLLGLQKILYQPYICPPIIYMCIKLRGSSCS